MTRLLFYSLLFVLISSCGKQEINEEMEEEETPIESSICHVDIDVNENTCANYSNDMDSIYCEPEYLGSFTFDDVIKNIANFYCIDSTSTIQFQNTSNEIVEFHIKNFSYSSDRSINWTNVPCPSDATKYTMFCGEQEQYSIVLESKDTAFQFTIRIQTLPILSGESKGKYYDRAYIYKDKALTAIDLQSKLVIGNGDSQLDYKNVSGQEYYESIELNNIEYFDVVSQDISNATPIRIKFYVSREKGIVGFLTPEGELYNLMQ